jgi:uncharacterized membrane protein
MSGAGLYLWIKTLHLVAFARDRNSHSARYFHILNEVPTVLMIAIVVMVIVRPV